MKTDHQSDGEEAWGGHHITWTPSVLFTSSLLFIPHIVHVWVQLPHSCCNEKWQPGQRERPTVVVNVRQTATREMKRNAVKRMGGKVEWARNTLGQRERESKTPAHPSQEEHMGPIGDVNPQQSTETDSWRLQGRGYRLSVWWNRRKHDSFILFPLWRETATEATSQTKCQQTHTHSRAGRCGAETSEESYHRANWRLFLFFFSVAKKTVDSWKSGGSVSPEHKPQLLSLPPIKHLLLRSACVLH